jgi:hypothetical protein
VGGSALLIYGNVSDDLLQPRPAPRSMMGRLLGRGRTEVPSWSQIGPTRRMIDLPAEPLKGLASAFSDYIVNRASPPWTASPSFSRGTSHRTASRLTAGSNARHRRRCSCLSALPDTRCSTPCCLRQTMNISRADISRSMRQPWKRWTKARGRRYWQHSTNNCRRFFRRHRVAVSCAHRTSMSPHAIG